MKLVQCLISIMSRAAAVPATDTPWVPVATELLQREKIGFGGLFGIVFDHRNGDLRPLPTTPAMCETET